MKATFILTLSVLLAYVVMIEMLCEYSDLTLPMFHNLKSLSQEVSAA